MENEERDIVVFTDEEDNEVELDVVRYFEHKGQEYAILMDFNGSCEEDDDCEMCEDCAADMYIMKVVISDEYEEFIPVEEDMFDELIEVVENLPDECECGCGHDHHHE